MKMANRVRVRVEMRHGQGGGNEEERYMAFKRLFTAFKKAVDEDGVMNTYKQHQTFESKPRKKRRKKHEAERALLKQKLKENFSPKRHYE